MNVSERVPAAHWTVAETFVRCPETAPVFNRFGMACVGCVMAPFETLAEAADAYGLDPEVLLAECRAAAECTERNVRIPSRGS